MGPSRTDEARACRRRRLSDGLLLAAVEAARSELTPEAPGRAVVALRQRRGFMRRPDRREWLIIAGMLAAAALQIAMVLAGWTNGFP